MSKKELEAQNDELKQHVGELMAEGQRISTAAQQIQAGSAQRLVIIRLLESFVNTTNSALQQLQRDLNEIQAPQQSQESED